MLQEFLSPVWAWMFDTFGVFGMVLACLVPVILIALAILLVSALIGLVKAIFGKKKPKSDKTANVVSPNAEQLFEKANQIKDPKQALTYYQQAATEGHVLAQYMTGLMYYDGFAAEKPMKDVGLRWLKRAAENGHIASMYLVGDHYFQEKQEDDAEKWLTMAAQHKYANAQYMLYQLYTDKLERQKKKISGRWQDDPKSLEYYRAAKHWLKEAAYNGHSEAEYIYF